MKILYLFFLTFLSMQNCSNQMQDKFPVKITEAYHQYWIAGVQGGGSGRSFYITFEKDLPADIEIIQLYFRKRLANAQKVSDNEYFFSFTGTSNFERGDEINTDIAKKEVIVTPPFTIKDNQAILEYTQKGIKKYFKIINVKEKEMLAYPSARPIGNDKN